MILNALNTDLEHHQITVIINKAMIIVVANKRLLIVGILMVIVRNRLSFLVLDFDTNNRCEFINNNIKLI